MKSLKHVFAFIIPLTAMLITFSLYLITSNVVEDYKKKISNDYSIIIVTNTPLIQEKYSSIGKEKVKKIVPLDKKFILDKIKSDLSRPSLQLLKHKLPYFYQIYLEEYPTSSQLISIKKILKQNKNIKKIEIFSKNHNRVFLLLVLINKIIIILFIVILIFSMIILSKQVTIWFYEHNERISIFQLHGASVLYSASTLLKYAMYGALISSIIVSLLYLFISMNLPLVVPVELSSLINAKIISNFEIMKIFALSFGISIITIFGVLVKHKIKND